MVEPKKMIDNEFISERISGDQSKYECPICSLIIRDPVYCVMLIKKLII